MEAEATSLLSSLRHRLRVTVCCCFGYGGAGADLAQWPRRAGVGEFRYDPLSYALNFDEGAVDGDGDGDGDVGVDDIDDGDGDHGQLLYRSFSSPPARTRGRTSTPAAVTAA